MKTAQQILEKVVEDYNSISDEFDRTRQYSWKEFEKFPKYLKEGVQIADIGCGNGRLYNFLQEKLEDFQYIGVDKSPNLIKKAQINFPSEKKNAPTFITGDLLEIPLDTASQDIVFCIAAFHHLPSKEFRQRGMKELNRILKQDGILILSNWNLFQPKYKKYIWKSRFKSLLSLGRYSPRDTFIPWSNSGVDRYYYAFKTKELQKLLKKENFQILEEEIDRNIVTICKKV